MFYVGIDVASEKHDICIIGENHKVLHTLTISNSKSGFTNLANLLETVAVPDKIKIGLEATGIYGENLAVFLRRKGYDVTTINPLLSKKHLSATTLRKTKTDKSDANNIALIIASEDFKPDICVSYHISELKSLTRARFFTVKDRSALKNKVKRLVAILFPELNNFFSDIFGVTGTAVLKKYPSAKKLAACNIETLTKLLRDSSRGRYGREKAEALRQLAKDSVGTHLNSRTLELSMLLDRIDLLNKQIEQYNDAIKEIMDEIDSPILSIPGIGYTLGAMIIAEIGDIHRFSKPAKLLAFAGMEPSIYQSGKYTPSSGKMVKRGSPFLRWALIQAAGYAATYSRTFREYRSKKLTEGKSCAVSRSHIAKKLVRVIFSILSHNSTFLDQSAA